MGFSTKTKTFSFYRFGVRFPTAIITATAVLYGCGGGDSVSDGTATTVPEEKPVTLPITEMPTSSYSGLKQEAFERLNQARIAAGVSALRQNAQLDAAAQAHAKYLTANSQLGHYEDSIKPFFTGYDYVDRPRAQGYLSSVSTEVVAGLSAPTSGRAHIDIHLNSVYHLAAALYPSSNELGIGYDENSAYPPFTISSVTLGTTDRRLRPVRATWTWPVDGANAVPTGFAPASEIPNAMPDIAPVKGIFVGTPVMFCAATNNYAPLDIMHLEFSDGGRPLSSDVRVLHHQLVQTSPQQGFDSRVDQNLMDRSNSYCIFLVPVEQLLAKHTYVVSVQARQGGDILSQTWSFTTAE